MFMDIESVLAFVEELSSLKDGEYKVMQVTAPRGKRKVAPASCEEFWYMYDNADEYECIKSKDGIYIATGFVYGYRFIVMAKPVAGIEKGILDALLTK